MQLRSFFLFVFLCFSHFIFKQHSAFPFLPFIPFFLLLNFLRFFFIFIFACCFFFVHYFYDADWSIQYWNDTFFLLFWCAILASFLILTEYIYIYICIEKKSPGDLLACCCCSSLKLSVHHNIFFNLNFSTVCGFLSIGYGGGDGDGG